MALKVKDRAKPKLPPVEPGVYLAVCVGVIDLGEQYSEKFKNYRNEVQFVWELAGETVEVDGEQKPRKLSRTFSVAASKKSNLRGFLGGWNGVQYSDEQFQDLDLFGQAGRPCQLNVVLNDTGEYANVDSVIPLPKGVPARRQSPLRYSGIWMSGRMRNFLPSRIWSRKKSKSLLNIRKTTPQRTRSIFLWRHQGPRGTGGARFEVYPPGKLQSRERIPPG